MSYRIVSEFRETWIRISDKLSVMIFDFPILLYRKFDFLDNEMSTIIFIVFGFTIHKSTYKWNKE